jgi:hypothetical protein
LSGKKPYKKKAAVKTTRYTPTGFLTIEDSLSIEYTLDLLQN